jgi:hypothetical protein
MTENSRSGFSLDVPSSWGGLLGRAVVTAAVGFVVLQAKEYYDAGRFDTPATAVDAALVAAGMFVVYAILKWGKF